MPAFARGGVTPEPDVLPPLWPEGWDLPEEPPLFPFVFGPWPPGFPPEDAGIPTIASVTADVNGVLWQLADGVVVDAAEGSQAINVTVTVNQSVADANHLLVTHIGWETARGRTRSTPSVIPLRAAAGAQVYSPAITTTLAASDLDETAVLIVRSKIVTVDGIAVDLNIPMTSFEPALAVSPTCSLGTLSLSVGVSAPSNDFTVDEVTAATVV